MEWLLNSTIDRLDNSSMNLTFIPYPVYNLPSALLIIVTVVYAVIFVFGVLGNILVIFVVCRNRDMRSSTNFFLVNLSVADLLVLVICMPVALLETYIVSHWLLGEVMCKLVPFLEHTTSHASVLTLVAIAVERYVAFCHPLKAQYICTTSRTIKICVFIWIVAGASCIPYTLFAKHEPDLTPEGDRVYRCGTYIDTREARAFIVVLTVLFFAVPFFLLGGLYTAIANALRISTQAHSTKGAHYPRQACNSDRNQYELANIRKDDKKKNKDGTKNSLPQGPLRARRRAVVMLFAVVVMFFICLLPQRAVTLIFIFDRDFSMKHTPYTILSLATFCRIMLYMNSSINPLLYSILSSKFRTAFMRALGIRRRRKCVRSNTGMTSLQTGSGSPSRKMTPSPGPKRPIYVQRN